MTMWSVGPLAALLFTLVQSTPVHTSPLGGSLDGLDLHQSPQDCEDVSVDLVFLLDSSVSLTRHNFELTKDFVRHALKPADIDGGSVRVAVIVFSDAAHVAFHLGEHATKREVLQAVDRIAYRPGNTNTAAALKVMREAAFAEVNGDRPEVDNVAVVVTDGTSNSMASTAYQADLAQSAGIYVYAVGVGLGGHEGELDRIASESRISVENFLSLTSLDIGLFANQCKCTSPMDVVFMVGLSARVETETFKAVRDFLVNAVGDLQTSNDLARIALLTYSGIPNVIFDFNAYLNDKDRALEATSKIKYSPAVTNLALALRVVRTSMMTTDNGDRPDAAKVLVIVTDGVSTDHEVESLLEARRLKALGATLVFVTLGRQGRELVLRLASQPSDGNVIEVPNVGQLSPLADSLVRSLCADLDPCSRNPCLHEGICIADGRAYTCVCPVGYYGAICQKACGPPSDIILLLDSTSSVGPSRFPAIKTFAQYLLTEMDLFVCDVTVGVIKFGATADIEVHLGTLETEDEIIGAIDRIRYRAGQSDLAKPFKLIRTKVYNNALGDRPYAQNFVYLITGGQVKTFQVRDLAEAELLVDSGARLLTLNVETSSWEDVARLATTGGLLSRASNGIQGLFALSSQHSRSQRGSDDQCLSRPCLNGGICQASSQLTTALCICPVGTHGRFCQNKHPSQADIVFAVDVSRGNNNNNNNNNNSYRSPQEFREVKKFLRNVVAELLMGSDSYRVAMVSYGASASVDLEFAGRHERAAADTAIQSLRPMPGTPNPSQALKLIKSQVLKGSREGVASSVVLVTSHVTSGATVGVANQLKVQGTRIVGVGVEIPPREKQALQAVISFPWEQHLVITENANQLQDLEDALLDFFPDESNGCRNMPCRNGGACSMRGKTYDCQCPTGWAGKDCDRSCSNLVDLVLVVQSDGKAGLNGFRGVKELAARLVDGLTFGPNHTRMGVVTMGRSGRVHFYLDSYTTKADIQTAITALPFQYDRSHVANGIRLARERLLSSARGDRPDARDVMILITDGSTGLHDEKALLEAVTAREMGVQIMAVGVGVAVSDSYAFDGLVTPAVENHVFPVESWHALSGLGDVLLDRICHSGDVCASTPCHHGGVCSPGLETDSFTCSCPPGSVGTQCQIVCEPRKNVAMVIDVSGQPDLLAQVMCVHFMADLVEQLTANQQHRYRFALLTFNSTTVVTVSDFAGPQTPERLISTLHAIPFVSTAITLRSSTSSSSSSSSSSSAKNNTATNVSDLYQRLNEVFLSADDRYRQGVENVAVFLTHAHSQMKSPSGQWGVSGLSDVISRVFIEVGEEASGQPWSAAAGVRPSQSWKVKTFLDLGSIRTDVLKEVCSHNDLERG